MKHRAALRVALVALATTARSLGAQAAELARRLLAPLGITNIGFGPPASPGKADQPAGHVRRPPFARVTAMDIDNPPLADPAGRLNLSIREWARWAQAVLRAASGGASPWTPTTTGALFTPPVATDSMAMGWQALRRPWAQPGGRILVHDGSNRLFLSVAVLAPEAGFAVLVVTNQGGSGGDKVIPGLANRLIRLVTNGQQLH